MSDALAKRALRRARVGIFASRFVAFTTDCSDSSSFTLAFSFWRPGSAASWSATLCVGESPCLVSKSSSVTGPPPFFSWGGWPIVACVPVGAPDSAGELPFAWPVGRIFLAPAWGGVACVPVGETDSPGLAPFSARLKKSSTTRRDAAPAAVPSSTMSRERYSRASAAWWASLVRSR